MNQPKAHKNKENKNHILLNLLRWRKGGGNNFLSSQGKFKTLFYLLALISIFLFFFRRSLKALRRIRGEAHFTRRFWDYFEKHKSRRAFNVVKASITKGEEKVAIRTTRGATQKAEVNKKPNTRVLQKAGKNL